MKKSFLALIAGLLIITFTACNDTKPKTAADYLIKTEVPVRPAGQTDVLQLTADPIANVRVAFIGVGMRGGGHPNPNPKSLGAIGRFLEIPGIEIVAICDLDEQKTINVNKKLVDRGHAAVPAYFGDSAWLQVTALPNVDLIYVATDWGSHATIGIQAMKDGKHVAIEVPAAMSLDDIWGLINTSEQTRKHCMQLENCVYDQFELTTLNMVQEGIMGDIVHGEGAYIHELKGFWKTYWNNWRMQYNREHRGDLYPTHGIGPVCQAMNIHRGDRMTHLVSMDAKQITSIEYIKEQTGEDVTDFKNGEHTSTLIGTEKGKTILIEHNVNSPRPYSRMYQLTGTKGFANKYPSEAYSLSKESSVAGGGLVNIEDLNAHAFVSADVQKLLMEKYTHPIITFDYPSLKGTGETFAQRKERVGGHGGMDFVMDFRLIYCLQNGLPLDMDVYDLAEWCSLVPLTATSLENGSAPVEIPDFTRGRMDKLKGLQFHLAK